MAFLTVGAGGAYATIQDAVNAASDGDTILVETGIYVEQVVVDDIDNLIIKAADGASVTIQAPADLVETARSSSGREINAVFTVRESANVTLEDIAIDGDGRGNTIDENDGPGQANFYGVYYRNSSGGLVDVDVTGIRDPYPGGTTLGGHPLVSGAQRGVGVGTDNDALMAFSMTGGSISDFQKNATAFNRADLDISGVTITGGGAQTGNAQNGIQISNSTGTVSGNTITGIGYAGTANAYSGAVLAFGNNGLDIQDNVITGSNLEDPAARVVGIYVFQSGAPSSGGSISGNTISHVDEGIDVSGDITPNGILIEDNDVTDIDGTNNDPLGVHFTPDPTFVTAHDVDGTASDDVLGGGAGNDQLSALGGDDVLTGEGGDDTLDGGGGNDTLVGGTGDDMASGGLGNDVFRLHDGGNDSTFGGDGQDIFFFIGSLTAADLVDGGAGVDTVVLQGNYAGGLTLSANVTEIESVSILAGSNTNFGEPGTNRYDYVLTTHDANFAAGVQARINGAALLAGEDFTFDGSAETNASFVVYGGKGVDTLTGGLGNDVFFFAGERFASGDTVNGGAGYDGMFLRGNYTIDFNAPGYTGVLTNIENLTLSSATDERYARGGTEFDYNLTLSDAIVGAGQLLTVSGTLLMATETMILDGSLELDGQLNLFGGKANDTLKGGAKGDLIHGNLGADTLTGGGFGDIFRFQATAESNSTSMDHITDFRPGTDKIELERIDANTIAAGNQAFTWIGSNAFTGSGAASAGQLRAYQNAGSWFVEGDTNGDGVADLVIQLTLDGPTPLSAASFFL